MRDTTSRGRRQTFVPQTNVRPIMNTSVPVVAPAMTEEEAAEKFSALILPYTRGDLAQASERTKEAAKHWKAGTRAPNSSSLITLARRIPRIREWVIDQMDAPLPAVTDDPNQNHAATIALLQMAANLPGQQGVLARLLLSKHQGGG